jgi:hypothetical protein
VDKAIMKRDYWNLCGKQGRSIALFTRKYQKGKVLVNNVLPASGVDSPLQKLISGKPITFRTY